MGGTNGNGQTSEFDKLARPTAKFPSNTLAKALASTQSTFDDEAEPTDDDLAFITRVRGCAAANLEASPSEMADG